MQIPIFVSIGRMYTNEHRALFENVSQHLLANGIEPQILQRKKFDGEKPLEAILRLMKRCYGTIVIAFPRILYLNGVEFPNSSKETTIGERLAPTIWNQIEASLAFSLKLPLLTFIEKDIHPEAMLNPKHSEFNAHLYDICDCQLALPDDMKVLLDAFINHVKEGFNTKNNH